MNNNFDIKLSRFPNSVTMVLGKGITSQINTVKHATDGFARYRLAYSFARDEFCIIPTVRRGRKLQEGVNADRNSFEPTYIKGFAKWPKHGLKSFTATPEIITSLQCGEPTWIPLDRNNLPPYDKKNSAKEIAELDKPQRITANMTIEFVGVIFAFNVPNEELSRIMLDLDGKGYRA